ncbi:unnamed protein product, partial [Tetraodon nigroviridis]
GGASAPTRRSPTATKTNKEERLIKELSPIKEAVGALTWLRAEVTRLLGCCVEDDAKLLEPSTLPEESPAEPGPVRASRTANGGARARTPTRDATGHELHRCASRSLSGVSWDNLVPGPLDTDSATLKDGGGGQVTGRQERGPGGRRTGHQEPVR